VHAKEKKMSEIPPNDILIQGINLLEAGDACAARELFEAYTKAHPEDPDGFFYLGDALAEDGLIDEALTSYREGLKLCPDDIDALTSYGDLLFEKRGSILRP